MPTESTGVRYKLLADEILMSFSANTFSMREGVINVMRDMIYNVHYRGGRVSRLRQLA